jgi:hypothetical protein
VLAPSVPEHIAFWGAFRWKSPQDRDNDIAVEAGSLDQMARLRSLEKAVRRRAA